MKSDLVKSLYISGSGMRAQSDRLRVIAENIANADSVGTRPGENPYQRKTISFESSMNRELGFEQVKVKQYGTDKTAFPTKYDPANPAADSKGYITMPNVNPIVEMMDMREARRGYEANVNVIEVAKSMIQQTIAMLR